MPRGKRSPTSKPEKTKRGRKPKMERRQRAGSSGTYSRQITDTVGLHLSIRAQDKPVPMPKPGGIVHVVTDTGQAFDLRISSVQKKKDGGYSVWSWLRKEAKDGPRWRAARLSQCNASFR